MRILYLALWILTVWGREANNLEAPYQASELVTLRSWALLSPKIATNRGGKREENHSFLEVVLLYLRIWDDLYEEKILPHAANLHALSFAAWSHEALDVNLALFETAGRVAMGGLWRVWLEQQAGGPELIEKPSPKLLATARALASMVEANPALWTPRCDDQGIDITLALMLLVIVPQTRATAAYWVSQTANATIICYKRGSGFPVIETDYATLIRHPERPDEEQRKEMTAGSILYPVLAAFAWGLGDGELVEQIDAFQRDSLGHCNFQTWVPHALSEARIWQGERTGSAFGSLAIGEDGGKLLASLRREIEQNTAYKALSAISLNHWPVLLMACRAYRMPPPPQLWLPLLDELKAPRAAEAKEWVFGLPRSRGGKRKVRALLLRCASYTALMRGLQPRAKAKANRTRGTQNRPARKQAKSS